MGEKITFEVKGNELFLYVAGKPTPKAMGAFAHPMKDAKVTLDPKRVPIEVWRMLSGIDISYPDRVTGYKKLVDVLTLPITEKTEQWMERWTKR